MMARSVGQEIPDSIRPLFDGTDLEAREGLTILLLTTTEAGWPHLAMLSVGEIVAAGARELRLALWVNSTATTNLARTGQATLARPPPGAERAPGVLRAAGRRRPGGYCPLRGPRHRGPLPPEGARPGTPALAGNGRRPARGRPARGLTRQPAPPRADVALDATGGQGGVVLPGSRHRAGI